jgi:hypothetical protein
METVMARSMTLVTATVRSMTLETVLPMEAVMVSVHLVTYISIHTDELGNDAGTVNGNKDNGNGNDAGTANDNNPIGALGSILGLGKNN